ncbi:MAG: Tar ligand binding domain-containing protein, partial [Betaproteobacteria bacterium]|nr:Tar ligand binding domain-containing protein [Betaproteobacteria bacterium]
MFSIGNMKIGVRLLGLLGLVLILMGAINILAQRNLASANDRLAQTYHDKLQPIRLAAHIQRLLEETRTQIMLGLQHNPKSELVKLHDHPLSRHTGTITKVLAEVESPWKELAAGRNLPPEEKAQLDDFEKAMRVYIAEGLDPAFKALVAEDYSQSNIELLKKTNPKDVALQEAATKLHDYYAKSADNLFKEAEVSQKQASALMLGAGILAAVLAVLLGLWITRSITRPLYEAVGVAQRVAAGDLTSTVEVKTKDETGQLLQALKDMSESLRKIVGEVRSSSEAIGSGTKQIATGNADLSQRTEEQASSLEETASSMEELTSTVKQNAENAKQANQLALGASAVAVKGGSVV